MQIRIMSGNIIFGTYVGHVCLFIWRLFCDQHHELCVVFWHTMYENFQGVASHEQDDEYHI